MVKKTNDPNQLTLFDLTPLAEEMLLEQKKPRWYYLASPRRSRMIRSGITGMFAAPHDLSHATPWVTNNKREAMRISQDFPGDWDVLLYPYIPF